LSKLALALVLVLVLVLEIAKTKEVCVAIEDTVNTEANAVAIDLARRKYYLYY
jgi:hypothetical protein